MPLFFLWGMAYGGLVVVGPCRAWPAGLARVSRSVAFAIRPYDYTTIRLPQRREQVPPPNSLNSNAKTPHTTGPATAWDVHPPRPDALRSPVRTSTRAHRRRDPPSGRCEIQERLALRRHVRL